jgi:hypothetical protein
MSECDALPDVGGCELRRVAIPVPVGSLSPDRDNSRSAFSKEISHWNPYRNSVQ